MTTGTTREGAPSPSTGEGAPSRTPGRRTAPDVDRPARVPGPTVPADWAQHPVVRAERHGWVLRDAWSGGDALVVRLDLGDADGLWGLGAPDGAARLLLDAAPTLRTGAQLVRSSLPRGTTASLRARADATSVEETGEAVVDAAGAALRRVLPAHLHGEPVSRWDWLSADAPPPRQPGEEHVAELVGDAGRAEARACLDVANPAAELDPADPGTRWWGWRDGAGTLRGVAGARRPGGGAPWVLGGIATDPAWRGRGIAAAVTAAATRAGLEEAPLVTLGMYAHNHGARRVYERVGYVVGQEFEARR